MGSFDVFFDQRPNKRLSKQSWGWWFEMQSLLFWRHCNVSQLCDISNCQSRGFDSSQDRTIRRLIGYWNGDQNISRVHNGMPSEGRFKKTYELLNLRDLKFSRVNKIHIFQCMGKLFCVEFQRVPSKFHAKYLIHKLKDTFFTKHWYF